jgi:hypothetical protein
MIRPSLVTSLALLSCFILFYSCNNNTETHESDQAAQAHSLSLEDASQLVNLPLACIGTEYPNKLSQTIGSAADLREPHT